MATCTAFGEMPPAVKFNDEVVAAPAASPGRIEMKPAAVGPTGVTFNDTPVAPAGTTVLLPVAVGMGPVTCNFCDAADTNGPGKPMSLPLRVSRMR